MGGHVGPEYAFGLATSTTISLATLIGIQTLPVIALILVAAALLDTHARRFGELQSKALKLRTETRRLRQELTIARDSLETQRQLDLQEERIARHVFKQLTLTSDQGLPGISTWNEPMGKLSGDLIQVARGPDSGIYLFLGDFTGHGLPAALGAVPASTIFRTMVLKGLEVSSIAGELNKKLHTLLPTGYFCCAAIMRLSPDRRRFTLWDGGLPPILIRRSDSGSVEEIHGGHLPLGVLNETEFSSNCSTWELEEADRVLVYTDGLTETQDLNGDSWGKDRLIHCLNDTAGTRWVIERLKAEILEFTHFAPPPTTCPLSKSLRENPARTERSHKTPAPTGKLAIDLRLLDCEARKNPDRFHDQGFYIKAWR